MYLPRFEPSMLRPIWFKLCHFNFDYQGAVVSCAPLESEQHELLHQVLKPNFIDQVVESSELGLSCRFPAPQLLEFFHEGGVSCTVIQILNGRQ